MRWRPALALVVLLLLAAAAGAGFLRVRAALQASLPQLDGRIHVSGLGRDVTVERDALGIPTVTGSTREDVARATGFLHAQDRFFQMDLARRRAAGELSALVGPAALTLDREIRIHRFRAEAQHAVSLLSPRDRGLLDAYTAGVNRGLAALGGPPFEYVLLRQTPQPWKDEDSMLVVLSMFITLQDSDGSYESTLATMHDLLPPAAFDFLAPAATEWDTPIDGTTLPVAPIPAPDVFNPRGERHGITPLELPPLRQPEVVRLDQLPTSNAQIPTAISQLANPGDAAIGSNSFAVSGRLTSDGRALVANDMHLTVRVPDTWYRAVLRWPSHVLAGLTLPGFPSLVAGSNTHVAWGFTNTYADWSDIVLIDVDPSNPERYKTPEGWRTLEHHDETIRVAGQADEHDDVAWTIWGPLIAPDVNGRQRALRWVAHSAERLAVSLTPLEDAGTIEQAFDEANGVGAPGQNMIVADRSGRIGWTVYGSIPRRTGIDGRLPASWADGSRGWNGWLSPSEYPRIVNPPDGRLWTANARAVGGSMLAALGDGSYEMGSRARIIRDRLNARTRFTARDLLAIQLDTGADFLSRWRDLLLKTLTPRAIDGNRTRTTFRQILERDWDGHASPGSAAYRLVRQFRELASARIIAFVVRSCYENDPDFDYRFVRRREGPIWTMLTQQPMHLLDPQYRSWDEFVLATVDDVADQAQRGHWFTGLRDRTWSEYDVTRYRHPLSGAIPLLGRWLDMPAQALAGDLYTVNMHWQSNAPSERMVVSPGDERNGIMNMPTGQSGNPLSPYYANSHPAWVNGDATPFLPGATEHTLTLTAQP